MSPNHMGQGPSQPIMSGSSASSSCAIMRSLTLRLFAKRSVPQSREACSVYITLPHVSGDLHSSRCLAMASCPVLGFLGSRCSMLTQSLSPVCACSGHGQHPSSTTRPPNSCLLTSCLTCSDCRLVVSVMLVLA